jgi:hypothetical protein
MNVSQFDIKLLKSSKEYESGDRPFRPMCSKGRFEIEEMSTHENIEVNFIWKGMKIEIHTAKTIYFEELSD